MKSVEHRVALIGLGLMLYGGFQENSGFLDFGLLLVVVAAIPKNIVSIFDAKRKEEKDL